MKYTLIFTLLTVSLLTSAQNTSEKNQNSALFELGKGLTIDFDNGNYAFNLGGMVQPSIGLAKDSSAQSDYFMNSKRTYFHIGGNAKNEHVAFFIQTDFSLSAPLLDAWVSYQPHKSTTITFAAVCPVSTATATRTAIAAATTDTVNCFFSAAAATPRTAIAAVTTDPVNNFF